MRTVPAVTGLTCLTLLLLTAAFIADRAFQQAGAWALLGLSLTVGFAHGALDAAVMQRRFTNRLVLVKWLAAYLAAVVLLGWLLSSAINVALWALILMSIWHFGEPYGRWNGLPSGSAHLTRAVVGGAPIMLPVCWRLKSWPVRLPRWSTPLPLRFGMPWRRYGWRYGLSG